MQNGTDEFKTQTQLQRCVRKFANSTVKTLDYCGITIRTSDNATEKWTTFFCDKTMGNSINACFISYRHPGDPGADKYVQAFVDQLKTHLAWYLPNTPVFFDQRRLGIGDFFDPKLAYELCRSACMIIFFSPCHFDPNHPYCAMEYKAMVELEKRRLDGGNVGLQHPGIIFPIVFRGSVHLPREIRDRQFESFENVMKWQDFQQRKYKIVIDKLASRIFDCYQKLHQANVFADIDCTKFCFQNKDDIIPWINEVAPLRRTMPR